MPSFNYKAIDQLGRPAMGQIDALNEVDLEIRLERMGLDLITYRAAAKSTSLFNRNKVTNQDLVMFCFQIEQLSSAGVPLLECLNDLREGSNNPYFQKVLGAVSAEVEGGKMLSQALAEHPNVFSEVFVSLVNAGEQTGQLPVVFNNLFNTIRWQDELMSQAKKLLAYPAFVAVVVFGAVAFLMSYLVPQMASFLRNMGQELPLNTKILIALSNGFVDYWWLIIGLPILIVIGLAAVIQANPIARYRFDRFKLNFPYTGPILHKIIMARFARYFALMYQTGIPILDAIKICEKIVGNRVVADALSRVHAQISAGESMSESFRNAGLFPQLVVRMVKVGESTGALDKSLLNVSYFYDRDVNDSMQHLLKMIEPALTVLLGLILGFIMYSVLGPVYDSFSKLKI
ncbi:type II secretion system F family protein [Methylotenera sp.]|uniref:type II secretion system F family protein n=3 Tax=Methylotenera sp. TaxID=2051956 RepID=UPI002727D6DE|nr:type II secretion system F family protein [Methylotenera sp.]MDO9393273.1 type II secretion system F family protein [Methylotenera sp.]MDP2070290.1 type II secretion system F family protein [Methylotenera sp.]MDP3005275.1 type II secretion system F family protein [Methylotenera sp.]MDP3308114.1 type II secretion system F family protein [Methylotenera sp.]